MSKIIIVKYEDDFDGDNLNKTFREAIDSLISSYKDNGCRANFGIIDSRVVLNICISGQCSSFAKITEKSLEEHGIYDVKITWIMGGSNYDSIVREIERKSGDRKIDYFNGVEYANFPLLYQFINK